MGIVYLIQPCELIGTSRYKVGRSEKDDISRINNYKKRTRILLIKNVKNPKELEKKIKEKFNELYKLCAGREYFECNTSEEEIISMFEKIIVSNKENNGKDVKNKKEICIVCHGTNISYLSDDCYGPCYECNTGEEDSLDEDECNTGEEDSLDEDDNRRIIDNYEDFLKHSRITEIIITDKVFEDGYLKYDFNQWYRIISYEDDEQVENLELWLENNCSYGIGIDYPKLSKDICNKCYIKNPKIFKPDYHELIMTEGRICDTRNRHIQSIPESRGINVYSGEKYRASFPENYEKDVIEDILGTLLDYTALRKLKYFTYHLFVKPERKNILTCYNYDLYDAIETFIGYGNVIYLENYNSFKELKDTVKYPDRIRLAILNKRQNLFGTKEKENYNKQEKWIEKLSDIGIYNVLILEKVENTKTRNCFEKYIEKNKEKLNKYINFNRDHEENIYPLCLALEQQMKYHFFNWCIEKTI